MLKEKRPRLKSRKMDCSCKTEIVGNVWFKEMKFEQAGDIKEGHKHTHDHVTFLTKGSIELFELEYDPKTLKRIPDINPRSLGIFTAPAYIKVPKEVAHRVISRCDDTIAYCVQAVRVDGEVITTDFEDKNYSEITLTEMDKILDKKNKR